MNFHYLTGVVEALAEPLVLVEKDHDPQWDQGCRLWCPSQAEEPLL